MKMNNNQNQKQRKVKNTPLSRPAKSSKTIYVWLNVLPEDLWLKVRRGETIWEAFQKNKVELNGDCGGLGVCGKCKIKVLSMIDHPTRDERKFLDEEEMKEGIRLACRSKLNHDLVVSTGEPTDEVEYSQILTTSHNIIDTTVPARQLEPLIQKRIITMLPDLEKEGLSHLSRIKLELGPEYQDLKSPLYCLRTLHEMLEGTHFSGTAVFHNRCLMAWQEQEEVHRNFGLVFDLGTTTLVGKLLSLTDGSEVAVSSCLNRQSRHGSDVISRLQYVEGHLGGLEHLHRVLIRDMNQLTARLLKTGGLKQDDIFVVVAAGNTIMQHFLLSLTPLGIARAPFSPVLTDGLIVKAADAGLKLHPEALLYMMPTKSGYIGGDLISVILTSGVAEQDEIILGLDLGTNGEIFLGNSKRLMSCSAAAGPALEGARISDGMIAKAGAIEGVSFEEGDLHYLIVGNIKPKGLCGSGLVELVGVLLELGIIDHEGLIGPTQNRAAQGLNSRLINRSGAYDFLIASAEESYDKKPVYLTQKDVRELQLAKAAIAAGIKTMTDEMGIGTEDISQVYLAGALGNYISPYSAMRIGLVPRLDPESIRSLGNAASTGASMVLLNRHNWQKSEALAEFIEHIELSSRLDFNEHFIEQLDFPRDNILDIYREDVDDEVMRTIKVGEAMSLNIPTISSTMALEEMSNLLRDTGHRGFLVLDEKGGLLGIVTLADLASSLRNGNNDLTVGDIATRELFVAYPDQSLHEVLQGTAKSYGRIPVVERHDRQRLVGVLRRRDIMSAYRKSLAQTPLTSDTTFLIPESNIEF